jgi:hypothetical protein
VYHKEQFGHPAVICCHGRFGNKISRCKQPDWQEVQIGQRLPAESRRCSHADLLTRPARFWLKNQGAYAKLRLPWLAMSEEKDWVSYPDNSMEKMLSKQYQDTVGLVYGYSLLPGTFPRAELPALVASVQACGWSVWGGKHLLGTPNPDFFPGSLVLGVEVCSVARWERTELRVPALEQAQQLFQKTDRASLVSNHPSLSEVLVPNPRVWMIFINWAEVIVGKRIYKTDLPWIYELPAVEAKDENEDEDEDDELESEEGMDPEIAAGKLIQELETFLPGSKNHALEDWESSIYGLLIAKLDGAGGVVDVPLDLSTISTWQNQLNSAPNHLKPLEIWLCDRTGYHHLTHCL